MGGTWQKISDKDWDLFPDKHAKAPDDIDQMLDAIERGEIVQYHPKDEKDQAGKRMALGRRAKRRGLTLQIRYKEGVMAIRQGGDSASQSQDGPGTPEATTADTLPENDPAGAAPRRRRRTAS